MTAETFEEELRWARMDLATATAEVMALVRDGKAFGLSSEDGVASRYAKDD